MKKTGTLSLFILLFALNTFGQHHPTEVIHHTHYSTTYDKKLHYPILVEWWDYIERCSCDDPLPRTDKFEPDPEDPINTDLEDGYKKLNKYRTSLKLKGYDRGHMCPAADNQCFGSVALDECFYFSNMAPQTHALNAGDWKTLETRTRKLAIGDPGHDIPAYDSIHVWCGSIGAAEVHENITVPEKCWKVIYIKKLHQYEAYIFDNTFEKSKGLDHWKTTVSEVEMLTGFTFK